MATLSDTHTIRHVNESYQVHFGGGVIGILLTPIFNYDGLIYYDGCTQDSNNEWIGDCNFNDPGNPVAWNTPYYQFGWNLCGLIAIIVWVIFTVGPVLATFKYMNMLRWINSYIKGYLTSIKCVV